MTRITILDPTAPPPDVNADPGPPLDAETMTSGRIGIRYDLTWRSFDWVRDEWARAFEEKGAAVEQWCAGDRTGEAAQATLEEARRFAGAQDAVISGLGN